MPSEPENGVSERPFSYVLPVASERPMGGDVDAYLELLSRRAELIVVDGSMPAVFDLHHLRWGGFARHVPPAPGAPLGKVGNVLTGIHLASNEYVVIADDDVRYGAEVEDLVLRLAQADVVRPQNYFDPLPWHAAWDSARSLLNRALGGGDWPGTLAVRRSSLLRAGGYAGDVLFENFELCRTIEVAGGRHEVAQDLFVRRLPPTTRHFLSQRVRQAYDELARPPRLVAFLLPLPTLVVLAVRGRWRRLARLLPVGAVSAVLAAEWGRRRDGAAAHFPFSCSLFAPLWVAERSLCVWFALAARLLGGVRYRGRRVRRAALSSAERRARVASGTPAYGVLAPSKG